MKRSRLKAPHGTQKKDCEFRAAVKLFDLSDALPDHVLDRLRQRSVVQCCGFSLAVIEHPAEEVGESLGLCRVGRVGWDQQPGEAGDRIGGGSGRVGDGDAVVGGHRLRRGGCGCGDAVGGCLEELAGCVAHGTVGHLVLGRVDQLDVAEGEGGLANHAGDAFISLLADTRGPLDGGVLSYLAAPVRADLREVVGEDVGGAASVGAIDGQDRMVWQADAGIVLSDAGVVPLGDLAEVDVGDDVAGEIEVLADAREVVHRDNRAEDGGDVHRLDLRTVDLLIAHGAIGGAEVNDTLGDLADTAAGADGLVVDLHAGVLLAVFAEPLGVDGVWKGGPCSVDVLCAGSYGCQSQYACCDDFQFHTTSAKWGAPSLPNSFDTPV